MSNTELGAGAHQQTIYSWYFKKLFGRKSDEPEESKTITISVFPLRRLLVKSKKAGLID